MNADRKTLDRAYRVRAGMIGRLQACACAFPIVRCDTQSGHHFSCSSHSYWLFERRKQLRAWLDDKGQSDEIRNSATMELERLDALDAKRLEEIEAGEKRRAAEVQAHRE